ncbi:uncharacterized protein LOC113503812 [Trichoplusia ni]|uniref:Uncharacterized protein LOC113503812 n=1 Tax=Trichoplusia ni TaxID=7111 RepID=A0A7E5WLT2_TRINI|nr:uncharacterized protein LOC113503812 [Trichoplusia ni]
MTSYFSISLFIFIVMLYFINSTLLSRYRNPNEYLSPSDTQFVQQIPDDMFESLVMERPELRGVLTSVRRAKVRHPVLEPVESQPAFRVLYLDEDEEEEDEAPAFIPAPTYIPKSIADSTRPPDYTDDMDDADDADDEDHNPGQEEGLDTEHSKHKSTRLLPFIVRPVQNKSRRFFFDWFDFDFSGKKDAPWKASCFLCNKWDQNIPLGAACYKAFHSADQRYISMKRFFRANCYYHPEVQGFEISTFEWGGQKYSGDKGLKRRYYGLYTGGCFKRFLDIGEVYTARGCRAHWPDFQKNLLSHRFRRLEALLFKKPEGCISSHAASLVPFSRGISLFSRFHVCTCKRRWCNSAPPNNTPTLAVFIVTLLFIRFI